MQEQTAPITLAPIVSVIVAAYNAATTLNDAVASIQAQTLREIEIIIIDDCSMDQTRVIGAALSQADNRIRMIALEQNGGPAAARNAGLDAARGDWIAVVDADDEILPGRLAAMVAAGAECDIIFDNLLYVDGDKTAPYLAQANTLAGPLSMATFIESHRRACPIPNMGFLKPLIRRATLENNFVRYDTALKIGEDAMLILTLMAKGARACFVPEAYYRYHRHGGSISARQDAASIRAINASYVDFGERHSLQQDERRVLQALIGDNDRRIAAADAVTALAKGRLFFVLKSLASKPSLAKPVLREVASRVKHGLKS